MLAAGFLSLALVGPIASLLQWVIVGARSERTSGATALDGAGLGQAVVNTVAVSAAAAVLTVLVVLPVAYLTSRYRSRVGPVASATVVAGFALPGIVIGLAFVFWVLNTSVLAGLYQTLPLLILAYVIHFGAQSMRASSVAVTAGPGPAGGRGPHARRRPDPPPAHRRGADHGPRDSWPRAGWCCSRP